MAGALEGITVIELAGIGPAPFAGMMLADHGARVIRVVRPSGVGLTSALESNDIVNRNRENLVLDLKQPEDLAQVLELIRFADALIEGNRPGVLERLGLEPDVLLADNPKLVIGRMTGWGQAGPKAHLAGHDINYIAQVGALHTFGRKGQKPSFPLNLVGDYGGGGMMLAFGVLAAILSARSTGKGQVVDCAMTDGTALLLAQTYTFLAAGMWQDEREANILDGGAYFYDTYETSDGKYIAIGPIEPQFHALLLEKLGLTDDPDFANSLDRSLWTFAKAKLESTFRTKSRDEWCAILEDTDTCFAPVLSLSEAPKHPANTARNVFIEVEGVLQPAPAPRFSATPAPPVRMK